MRLQARLANTVDASETTRGSLVLLDTYCVELAGDIAAARRSYSILVGNFPAVAPEAALRLRELARKDAIGEFDRRAPQGNVVRKPGDPPLLQPLVRPAPLYPAMARGAGVEGWAIVRFDVARDGSVRDPIIVESDPPFVFDGAVLEAVRSWTYERPPVEIRGARVKLQFELNPTGSYR